MTKRLCIYVLGGFLAAAALTGGFGLRVFFEGRAPAPENFIALTKIAPLFYSPEIDTIAWRQEVKELEKLSAIMNRMYRDMKSRGAAADSYADFTDISPYPLAFLASVPDVVKHTDAFFGRPTKRSARALIGAYERAAAAYRKDAEHFSRLARAAFEANPDARIVFLGSATTPGIIRNDAALLLKNADALDAEIAKRKICLRGGQCELNVKKFQIATRPPATVPPLPDIKKYSATLQTADVRGPFFYPSRCWHNENGAPAWELLYVFFPQNAADGKMVGAKLATENYYSRMQPGARNALVQAFIGKDLEFFSTTEANPYRCTDLDYWQALATMNWLSESLAQKSTVAALPESVKRLEDTYREARYPSWDVVLELANAYQGLAIDGNADQIALKMHQMLRGRLAEFPATLATLNDLVGFFLKLAKADKSLPIDYFIQISSYFPLMFMNFSHSVWLADEKPMYLVGNYRSLENTVIPEPGEILPAEQNVFTLSVLKQYFSEEEIIEIHRKTSEANRELESIPLR